MRTFFQGKGESIVINGEISVMVVDIAGDEVVLAIDAPEWVEIDAIEASRSRGDLAASRPMRPR